MPSGRRESNSPETAWKTAASPVGLTRRALGRNRTDAGGLRNHCTAFVLQGQTCRADDGIRTRLVFVGDEVPRQAASSASVPPVGLEPTPFRVRTGSSALELRRQYVPPPGIEPGPLGFQPSAQTFYARVASRSVRSRLALSSLFGCHAPSAPCRCRSAMS